MRAPRARAHGNSKGPGLMSPTVVAVGGIPRTQIAGTLIYCETKSLSVHL